MRRSVDVGRHSAAPPRSGGRRAPCVHEGARGEPAQQPCAARARRVGRGLLMSAIVAVELRKQFTVAGRTIHAVRGVSFALAPGALCAIVGPSGSGKSTLLTLLGGLDVPTAGEVWIGTTNIGRMSAGRRTRFRAANVGFVFQAHNLVPVLTAAENVALPLTLLPLSARERARRVGAVLDDLGLHDLAHHRPGELSGGQQQRVGLARALVTAPAIVLADEPTAHLDSRTARDVVDVMRAMNRRRATTILLATHDDADGGRARGPAAHDRLGSDVTDAVRAVLDAQPAVEAVAPRLEFQGLASAGPRTLTFAGIGVDPAPESHLRSLVLLTAGEWFTGAERMP